MSPSALDRLARAPHWIQRALIRVLKLGDPSVTEPVPRGQIAARIAATVHAVEMGNPLCASLRTRRAVTGRDAAGARRRRGSTARSAL